MLIDSVLPNYDVVERHWALVQADVPTTFEAIENLDLSTSIPVRLLFGIRGLPHLLTGKVNFTKELGLQQFIDFGFVVLAEEPPNEIVLGAVGRFWRPASGMEPIRREEFASFDRPGYAKAAMNLHVSPAGRFSIALTETRVACTDDRARAAFLRYWRLIGPFSGWIRRILLEGIRREAEGT